MTIGGISIILLLGILNFLLILFQVSTGLRWVKAPFKVHKRSGLILLVSATLHGLIALLAT